MSRKANLIYFRKLSLENVRCFGERQELDLTDDDGRPAQWTLVIGDNGAGKTTLLQCLAYMRPEFNPDEDKVQPELVREENRVLSALARSGSDAEVQLEGSLSVGLPLARPKRRKPGTSKPGTISTTLAIKRKDGDITDVDPGGDAPRSHEEPPLVLAYGAGRHPKAERHRPPEIDPVQSLFRVESELCDAEKNLCDLEYASLTKGHTHEERQRARKLLDSLTFMLAEILPDVQDPRDVRILGPRSTAYISDRTGVHVRTPSGEVPLDQLSLGYQTMFALTMDIAWRLIERYPTSSNPFEEPAIVIVDEIDLHLHPRWQREIRENLTGHFPNVKNIATAHSPLMAQSSLSQNLAVVRWQEDRVTIENDPAVIRSWRLDQVLTSDLFGFESARPPETVEQQKRRVALRQKQRLSKAEREELADLDRRALELPTAESPEDQKAMEVIRKAAELLQPGNLSS